MRVGAAKIVVNRGAVHPINKTPFCVYVNFRGFRGSNYAVYPSTHKKCICKDRPITCLGKILKREQK